MQDFYLKFTDEAQANFVLYTVTPAVYEVDEEGNATDVVVAEEQVKPNYQNIDVLGIIYEPQEPSGLIDEAVEPVAKDGYHVNVRIVGDEDGSALEAYAVMPSIPRRVWS